MFLQLSRNFVKDALDFHFVTFCMLDNISSIKSQNITLDLVYAIKIPACGVFLHGLRHPADDQILPEVIHCIQFFCLISRSGAALPGALCRSPNTISGVRSKKPISFFFPAHPAFTMLQADELLFHLPSAVRADLIVLSHRSKSRLFSSNRKSQTLIIRPTFSLLDGKQVINHENLYAVHCCLLLHIFSISTLDEQVIMRPLTCVNMAAGVHKVPVSLHCVLINAR